MKHVCAKKVLFFLAFFAISLCGCTSRPNHTAPGTRSEATPSTPLPQTEDIPPISNDDSTSDDNSTSNDNPIPTETNVVSPGLFKFGSDISDSSLTSDGQFILATTSEGHIQIFDLIRDTVTHTFKFRNKVKWARLNMNLKQLIVVYENNLIEIRTFPGGNLIKTIHPEIAVSTCILSPQENFMVLTFENNTGDIYDLKTSEVVRSFQHQAQINDVVFSPDSTYVRTASDDGTSLLFDLKEFKLVSIYRPDVFDKIEKIQISSDNRFHAFINPEGYVEVADITSSEKEISEVTMSHNPLHPPLQFHPTLPTYLRLGDEFILFDPLFHARTTEWFFQEDSCPTKDMLLSPSGSSMLLQCAHGILNLFTTPGAPQEKPELLQTITHVMPDVQSTWFHPRENLIIIVSKTGFILVTTYEEKTQILKTTEASYSLHIDPYAHIEEVENIKEEDIPRVDYFGLSDAFPHQHQLLGLAIVVGGGLVYKQSLHVDAAATKIGKLLKIADPKIRYERAQQHFSHKGYDVRRATSKAGKLAQSNPGIRGKLGRLGRRGGNLLIRGASKVTGFAAVLVWFYGMAEGAMEPTPTMNPLLVDQEKQLAHLKQAFEELEASPLNQKIQKKYIYDLTEFLRTKSNLLKLDYRVAVAEINSVLEARDEFTESKVQEAEREFLEFRLEQTQKIYFIDSVYETLRNVSMLETIDANDAQNLIDETFKRLSE